MLTFFDHLNAHYDWRWAGLAALICGVGVPIAFKLLADAREGAHRGRRTKALGSVVVGCLTLWTTHFVAMNGYDFGGALHFDPLLTVGSYLMALASVGTTYLISTRGKTAAWRAVAGAAGAVLFVAMAVLSLTGTHVTGQAIRLDWNIIALAATASAAVTAAGAGVGTAVVAATAGGQQHRAGQGRRDERSRALGELHVDGLSRSADAESRTARPVPDTGPGCRRSWSDTHAYGWGPPRVHGEQR